MKINKFEATGMAISVGLMVLALFLVRIEQSPNILSSLIGNGQTAAPIIVANNDAEFASAVEGSRTSTGKIAKLIIDDVVIGTGAPVAEGDTVTVNYIGSLQNGQQFDNSLNNGEPFTFTVGEGKVIEGWDKGLIGMKVGGQRVLVIPADMAYGDEGYGPIPGGATLVYVIQLLSIE